MGSSRSNTQHHFQLYFAKCSLQKVSIGAIHTNLNGTANYRLQIALLGRAQNIARYRFLSAGMIEMRRLIALKSTTISDAATTVTTTAFASTIIDCWLPVTACRWFKAASNNINNNNN